MNTWRDIKEAPLNQAVFATDGDMVFFGRFAMTADRKCMFEGQDIEEACNYGIEPSCLTGWQPTPDTWKSEESADEMFRELGYHCMEPVPQGIIMYQMPFGPKIEICTETGEVSKEGENYNEVTWTTPEILACAQLIREWEVAHADNR